MKRTLQTLTIDDTSNQLKQFHFKLINYGSVSLESHTVMNKRFLSHYRIFIVDQGSFNLIRNTIHYPLNKGDLMMVSPNILYSAELLEQSGKFYYLDFTFDDIKESEQFNELFRIHDVIHMSELINERQIANLSHLDQTVQVNFPGTYLLIESMLLRILIVMIKRLLEQERTFKLNNSDHAKERLLLECCKYIDEHLDEPLTVKQIAQHFNYSENYIYKAFNETLNISCKTYILEYRLSKAFQDLKSTTLPISEIAQRNGFSTIYHFSNAFKKKYGFSPLNYRKAMGEK